MWLQSWHLRIRSHSRRRCDSLPFWQNEMVKTDWCSVFVYFCYLIISLKVLIFLGCWPDSFFSFYISVCIILSLVCFFFFKENSGSLIKLAIIILHCLKPAFVFYRKLLHNYFQARKKESFFQKQKQKLKIRRDSDQCQHLFPVSVIPRVIHWQLN